MLVLIITTAETEEEIQENLNIGQLLVLMSNMGMNGENPQNVRVGIIVNIVTLAQSNSSIQRSTNLQNATICDRQDTALVGLSVRLHMLNVS